MKCRLESKYGGIRRLQIGEREEHENDLERFCELLDVTVVNLTDGWQKNVTDSNTKEFQPVKLDFPLFSMSQWRMPHSFAIQYGGFCTM